MSLSAFFAAFPEFADGRAPESLVQAKLDEASRRVCATVWGPLTPDGIGYLAAHLLSTSPWGQRANLLEAASAYESRYKSLLATVTVGAFVV